MIRALLTLFRGAFLAVIIPCIAVAAEDGGLVVGSKKFTESVTLGELATQLIRGAGARVEHRAELGGTRVLWSALLRGDIDIYPEYTGTLRFEVLAGEDLASEVDLNDALARHGIVATAPLGFENNYAIGMLEARAKALSITRISDLPDHPQLRLGLGNEFLNRGDGWPGLREHYGLSGLPVTGLDHDLAYRGLAAGQIDVMDLYTTDAEIAYYNLRALEDDKGYFPRYAALYLYRAELQGSPAVAAIESLTGHITTPAMIAMNVRAKLDGIPAPQVAAEFLATELDLHSERQLEDRWDRLRRRTVEHLAMVGVSMAMALLLALPLGVVAFRLPRLGHFILGATGVVQTIPALALLVFMIPLFGIGWLPAIMALFLYSLLPIVRNTHAGLGAISPSIVESADAMGLSRGERLRIVELPLAAGAILAGIKTALVINIGTATLGALIGAGGYGQPILTGIRLDDTSLILEGALPAAALALIAQGLFEWGERTLLSVQRGQAI